MILSRIDYRIWRKYIWWILGGACFLLVLCYVPGIGKEINGERRWITIGMQFQPSECAKLCMMMALANWLALYRDHLFLVGFCDARPYLRHSSCPDSF